MRVTDKHLFASSQKDVMGARARLAKVQGQASSGMRIEKASDDPLAAAHARRELGRERRAHAHERSIDAGLSALQMADAALDEVGGAIARMKEIAIQQASDTMSAQDRANAAKEVQQLREVIREVANTEQGGRHVFAGLYDDREPFDASGVYLGSPDEQSLEVAPGMRVPTTMTGDQIFAPSTGTDVFASIDALATALSTDDVIGIRGAMAGLDASASQVSDARATMGARAMTYQMAHAVNERVSLHAAQAREELVGIDPIESFTGYVQAQQALTTAIQIAAQLPPAGLVGQ